MVLLKPFKNEEEVWKTGKGGVPGFAAWSTLTFLLQWIIPTLLKLRLLNSSDSEAATQTPELAWITIFMNCIMIFTEHIISSPETNDDSVNQPRYGILS
ncbi:unnamed protein product [Agarophyton chilense]